MKTGVNKGGREGQRKFYSWWYCIQGKSTPVGSMWFSENDVSTGDGGRDLKFMVRNSKWEKGLMSLKIMKNDLSCPLLCHHIQILAQVLC